jgi:heme/copper-type cytochrome/quinol oxidase subunit 2
MFQRKPSIFNIIFVSYNVSLQPNIMQNYWKTCEGLTNIFKMTLGIFGFVFCFLIIIIIKYSGLGWAEHI